MFVYAQMLLNFHSNMFSTQMQNKLKHRKIKCKLKNNFISRLFENKSSRMTKSILYALDNNSTFSHCMFSYGICQTFSRPNKPPLLGRSREYKYEFHHLPVYYSCKLAASFLDARISSLWAFLDRRVDCLRELHSMALSSHYLTIPYQAKYR